jgi:hypothetical protein
MEAISALFVGATQAIGGAAGAAAGFIGQHAGTIMTVGGEAFSAYSTLEAGKEAAKAGKRQQELFEAEAEAELTAGGEAARIKREEGRRLTASQIAAISASGAGLVGSNLVVMAESAQNVELDALTLERNAGVRARALKVQGALAAWEGRLARRKARMRAFSDIMGTAGQGYLQYKKWKGSQKLGKSNIGTMGYGTKQAGTERTYQRFTTGK